MLLVPREAVLGREPEAMIYVAEVREAAGPVEIERQNRERVVRVECNTHGRSMGEVIEDTKKGLARISLPPDLVIRFAIPFTFTGVILGFLITRTTLSVITFLGMVMLMGIVVNNAIVLISYINILRARGLSMQEAVTQGGRARLRPVLMTTITTLAGLLPLALSRGQGAEIWQPLGITMISGLTVSTLITMVFVPTFYAMLEGKIRRHHGHGSARRMAVASGEPG